MKKKILFIILSVLVLLGISSTIPGDSIKESEPYHLLVLEIKQKDAAEPVTMCIAVDERLYESVNNGQKISHDFNHKSYIFGIDRSKASVKVLGKYESRKLLPN